MTATLLAVLLSGCKKNSRHFPDDGEGGSGGSSLCDGYCAPPKTDTGIQWHGPSAFAMGPYADLPACPPEAPNPGLEAYAGLQPAPHACPECTCDPAETTCTLPTEWHVAASKCGHTAASPALPFPAPADWTGTCAEQPTIPAGATCNGAPCVQSVLVAAPEAVSAPCAPRATGDALVPPPAWAERARECLPDSAPAECEDGGACLRLDGGLIACIYHPGDLDCPAGPYTDRHLLHSGIADTRACPPCTCGPPQGGSCTLLAKAFTGGACDLRAGAAGVTTGDPPACFDVVTGIALTGKQADLLATTAATCTPTGGLPAGLVAPAHPVTLCCIDPPPPT